jgi:hypothetical protein
MLYFIPAVLVVFFVLLEVKQMSLLSDIQAQFVDIDAAIDSVAANIANLAAQIGSNPSGLTAAEAKIISDALEAERLRLVSLGVPPVSPVYVSFSFILEEDRTNVRNYHRSKIGSGASERPAKSL